MNFQRDSPKEEYNEYKKTHHKIDPTQDITALAIKNFFPEVLVMAQGKRIQLGTMRLWVSSLASLSGLRIQHCRELCVGCKGSSDPELLWQWRRAAAVAPGT